MTRAILLVDHGSRREQANALLDAGVIREAGIVDAGHLGPPLQEPGHGRGVALVLAHADGKDSKLM